MKTVIALQLILLFGIGASHELDSGTISDTFIRYSVHEFGSEYDTPIITPIASQYQINENGNSFGCLTATVWNLNTNGLKKQEV